MHDPKLPHMFVGRHNAKYVVAAWKVSELIEFYDHELSIHSKLFPFIKTGVLIIRPNHVVIAHTAGPGNTLRDPDARVLVHGDDIYSCDETFFNENYEPITVTNMDDTDNVNHPSHYTQGKIEVWDFIIDQDLDYCSGNVVKYICRAGKKDPAKELEDLKKAEAYLQRRIRQVKEQKDA